MNRLPELGAWAKEMEALLGFIIIATVFLMTLRGSFFEWIAEMIIFGISDVTKSLPANMFGGTVVVAAT